MNEFLNEVARLWWVEVGTKLQNPLSEESLKGLRRILKEEYDFDSEVIEYIIESAVKTPTNFHLGGNRESGMQVGSNDTAVSAHLHHDGEDDEDGAIEYDEPIEEEEEKDEEETSTDKERPDSGDDKEKSVKDISKGSLTTKEKEELKEIDDKLLKTKLTNPTTGNKNQVSTLLGKKKSDPAAYKVGRNFLGDKGVSDDEIEKQSDSDNKKEPQANGYVGDKDKSLKQGDPSKTEEYQRELPPDDKEFADRNKKFANPIPPEPYKLPEDIVKNPKFPKKYLTALERMANTQPKGDATKWQHFSDIPGGAGQVSAQAGELMTMMGASMSDKEFESFSNSLLEHEKALIEKNPSMKKEGSRIVTKSWVEATKQSRKAIRDRITDQYGEGTEVIATAWDTKSDVEAMGLSDYEKNKGFSTDMYMKVRKPDGTEVMDEVSLKKSTKVNFLNSGAGSFEEWDKDLPDEINQKVYRKKARQRNVDFIKNNRKEVEDFIKSDKGESIRKLMESKGVTLEEALEGNSRNKQNVLYSSIKEMAKNGNKDAQAIKDTDDKNHNEFCKKSVEAIVDNPKMKAGMLNDIRNEFPLKAVSDGEETMAIGPNSLDKKTMEKIFGTSDYEKLKENLVAEPPKQLTDKNGKPAFDKNGEPKMSQPYIGYKIEASGEVFPVADIKVREDGRGYGGQFKFEMTLNQKSFAKRLEQAQSEVYGEE
jgi:hypothetical protein